MDSAVPRSPPHVRSTPGYQVNGDDCEIFRHELRAKRHFPQAQFAYRIDSGVYRACRIPRRFRKVLAARMSSGQENRRTLGKLLAFVAVVMFFFGFGLVPFYKVMCNLTGVNNIAAADQVTNTQIDHSRLVTVEFDTNTHQLPWHFRSLQSSLKVHPGELTQALFEVSNDRNYAVSGQAIASYGPAFAAQYFKKIECFCFTRQTLNANEKRRMPVVFMVDGKLPKDVNTITLSYTFFEVDGNRAASTEGLQAVGAAGT